MAMVCGVGDGTAWQGGMVKSCGKVRVLGSGVYVGGLLWWYSSLVTELSGDGLYGDGVCSETVWMECVVIVW